MKLRFAAAGTLLVALAAPSLASAYPIFDVTASEVLSVDPPRVKTTFTIVETGYIPQGWCPPVALEVWPLNPEAPDAPRFFACDAPTGALCGLVEHGAVTTVGFAPIPYGDALSYSIVTDRAEPCVRIEFQCVTLIGAVPPLETCLAVDMPVPASNTSWGAVKSTYR